MWKGQGNAGEKKTMKEDRTRRGTKIKSNHQEQAKEKKK